MKCQSCDLALKKAEVHFVDENTFLFLKQLPEGVSLGTYCYPCFDRIVGPSLEVYNDKMERAKNVNVFYASQSKESRFIRRIEKPIKVEDCDDRDEVILKLAFLAVEANQNTLVDVEVNSTKTRNGGWQSSRWSGKAIPAVVDEAKLRRRFPGAPN